MSPKTSTKSRRSARAIAAIDIDAVKSRILHIRNQEVLLDRDVAALYGVSTREINQAVRNNRNKFPNGYVFEMSHGEVENLRSNVLTANVSSKSRVLPKAFTEKGLYMLATILRSRRAVDATFAIIETFAEVRAIKRELRALHEERDDQKKQSMMQHFGEALADIVTPDLTAVESESSLELNFLIGKLKHTVRRIKKSDNN